ncbi:hypothetical protein [Cryptosporangium sp. NPDC048952]|uniref:hypothetical protein n=1 Tax=Cryptosporangium sp. NPDC048952 TaxID=3363961 RepID=UPI0037107AB3
MPDNVLRRLTAEAERRGVPLADVVADLAAHLPPVAPRTRRKLAFIGVGSAESGSTDITNHASRSSRAIPVRWSARRW